MLDSELLHIGEARAFQCVGKRPAEFRSMFLQPIHAYCNAVTRIELEVLVPLAKFVADLHFPGHSYYSLECIFRQWNSYRNGD